MKRIHGAVFLLSAAALAAVGTALFAVSFPKWNVPLYFGSLALLALSFGAVCFLYARLQGAAHPVRRAVIGFFAYLIAAFACVTLVNNVLLHETKATLAALIVSVLFAAGFLLAAAILTAASGAARWQKAVSLLLCTAVLAGGILPSVTGAKDYLPKVYKHPFVSKIAETQGLDHASTGERLFLNADDSHWWRFWTELAENGAFDDESVNSYVMQYANTDITDLLFCIFCQNSNTPTDVMTFRGDLYGQTEQNGKPVDYSMFQGLSVLYNEQQIDVFAKWIDKCREVGIRPWLSLRMNDRHDWDFETSELRGDLFYLARENGWMIGDEYGEFRNCLDYKVPEVRQIMLNYTREQLLRYDVDGIELDFMRELYCFDYLHEDTDEIVGIMNDYMRETAKIVKEAEAKWGHDILLSARLMRDIDECRAWGFDPETWSREGLVDAVTVAQWWYDDSAMPIADWKSRCPGTEILACVDRHVYAGECTPEVVRGFAAQYLTAGADGMYLFNWMSPVVSDVPNRNAVYETCGGGLNKVLTLPRRHIVTWQDMTPAGWEPCDPLPLKVKKNKTAALAVETGYIPKGAAVTVYLGLDRELVSENELALSVNGRACTFAGRDDDLARYGGTEDGGYFREACTVYRFALTDAADLPNLLTLSFANGGKTLRVTYCEVDVTV